MSASNNTAPIDGAADVNHADLMIDIAAGVATPEVEQQERRSDKRHEYTSLVALAPVDESGTMHQPCVQRGKNISVGGICLLGRTVFAPGTPLVMQLIRSNGSTAVVGARVQHCRYIGDMQHETGIEFTPLAKRFNHEELLDSDGNLRLLHPELKQQLDAQRRGEHCLDARDDPGESPDD